MGDEVGVMALLGRKGTLTLFGNLNACAELGDPVVLPAAMGDVAKALSMTELANSVGLSREGLYKTLSARGNPRFATVLKVAKALGGTADVRLRSRA